MRPGRSSTGAQRRRTQGLTHLDFEELVGLRPGRVRLLPRAHRHRRAALVAGSQEDQVQTLGFGMEDQRHSERRRDLRLCRSDRGQPGIRRRRQNQLRRCRRSRTAELQAASRPSVLPVVQSRDQRRELVAGTDRVARRFPPQERSPRRLRGRHEVDDRARYSAQRLGFLLRLSRLSSLLAHKPAAAGDQLRCDR